MMEALLKKLESLVGTDDFDYESEEIMEQLEEAGAGQEIIADLLGIMERHPLDDFGMPGAMVHFIERFHPAHLPLLSASLRRAPALSTVWMLSRCINGGVQAAEGTALLSEIAGNAQLDPAIRDLANSFLNR
ncbi:MAG: hypothetical protein IK130_07685 [Oscillospiraceae bacterium]|nr:hypothetical protein [Oscillospiraceae bacterium]